MQQEFNQHTISATPHNRSKSTVESIMRDVIIALLPASVMGVWIFGTSALLVILVSIAACVVSEYFFQVITKKPITITDCSAVVTGLLLALNLPPSVPLYVPIIGSIFAIIVAKQIFGGLGQNFINPALAARAFLLTSYPGSMTSWTINGISTATPLAQLADGGPMNSTFVPQSQDYINALVGNIGGCIGETCVIALVIGGLYLLIRKVITWRIPVIYILTTFIFTAIFGRYGMFNGVPLYELVTGGLLLGAIFMATDYSSSPVTPAGQVVFAIGCGLLTGVIRIFGGYPEGVSYSILIMNLTVPLINKFIRPRVFGTGKGAKK